MNLRLRPATLADRQMIYMWRNDPWIVSLGQTRSQVSWTEHCRWFETVLARNCHALFVIETVDHQPMGCVRFDRFADAADVSIYLMKSFVGKGFGTIALSESCVLATRKWPDLAVFRAVIRPDNAASIRVFQKVGFTLQPSEMSGLLLFTANAASFSGDHANDGRNVA